LSALEKETAVGIDRRRFIASSAAAVGGALAAPGLARAGSHSHQRSRAHGREDVTFPLGPFEKYAGNPILEPDPSHDWESAFLFNPAAIVVGDRVALLYRAQNAARVSAIGLAFSRDGLHFSRRPEPVLTPTEPYESQGVEDARVIRVGRRYYMTYTGYDGTSALLCLATSRDLVHWTKHGPLFPDFKDPLAGGKPWSKSGAILATPIRGTYWMWFGDSNHYWARSRDLIHWEHGPVDDPAARPVFAWESSLIEPGPPPILTSDNKILLVYNGRAAGGGGYTEGQYSGGQLLIDPRDPTQAIARLEHPFIFPTSADEQNGQVNNVVFSEGLVHFRRRWFLYFGMADSVLGAAVWTP
jgi:beta-1,2-mannosidase